MTSKNKPRLDLRDRKAGFSALEAETFDVLIIGAGITGCGTARDLAKRGVRVAVVDASDIASGTSSKSSKLIHGGLRYLAQGDVGLVREAANERRTTRRIAPHLALTNPMVILGKGITTMTKLKAALWTYEKLGHVDKAEHYQVWNRDQLKKEEPAIRAENYDGAIVYPEYVTDDSRLTLGNALSAVAHGAVIMTHAKADKLIMEDGQVMGVELRGTLSGEDITARVKAKVVVNAAGPWVDEVRRFENPGATSKLQLTKGIHLVFSREKLPVNRTVVMRTPDKRGIYTIPAGEFVYLGTTDTFYAEPEYWPEITLEDIEYLTRTTSENINTGAIGPKDVISAFAGLRPLIGQKGKKPSEISRKEEIMEGAGGMLTIAGGKLTSYRYMAERLADMCQEKLGAKPNHSDTGEEPLPGGDFSETISELISKLESRGMPHADADRCIRLYGIYAFDIFSDTRDIALEVEHAVLHEGALTLEDVWVRRTARAWFSMDGGLEALNPMADIMAPLLGWSEKEKQAQIEICKNQMNRSLTAIT